MIEWVVYKKPTALGLATGAVAGLVAITPASGFVGPMAALLIGGAVAFISFGAIRLKAKFGYDDTLDVFGVHGVGGIWGAIATGLFAQKAVNSAGADGLFFGGGAALLVKQFIAVGIAVVFAAVMTLLIGGLLKAIMGGLAVTPNDEEVGLDISEHGESGYTTGTNALPSGGMHGMGTAPLPGSGHGAAASIAVPSTTL